MVPKTNNIIIVEEFYWGIVTCEEEKIGGRMIKKNTSITTINIYQKQQQHVREKKLIT